MTCPVCLQQPTSPRTLHPCGHILCKSCLAQWSDACSQQQNPTTCPLCRGNVTSNSDPLECALSDTAIAEKLSRFQAWCDSHTGPDPRPHQTDGVKWCLQQELTTPHGFGQVRGGLICDEMGLGKTMIALGLVISNFRDRTLIVMPPALITQWVSALKHFCGHAPLVYHGPKKGRITKAELDSAPIVLTSYHTLAPKRKTSTDLAPLHAFDWDRVILDEAHHMRNQKTLYQGVAALRKDIVWMITGTPVHNRLQDLNAYWLLLGVPHTVTQSLYTTQKHVLHTLIRERVLRRTKDEVGIHLPPVQETTIHVPWSDDEESDFAEQLHSRLQFSQAYRERVTGAAGFLTNNSLPALVRCRQSCVSSSLMDPHIQFYRELTGDHEVAAAPAVASKIRAVVTRICKRRILGRKLVFCTYHGEIDLLAALLRTRGFTVRSIDGRVSMPIRAQYISESPDVLLAQIYSGSEGLNLQSYSDLYVVSPHWNPSLDDQAIARAHRIGQTMPVHVSRFIIHSTLVPVSLDAHALLIQNAKRYIRPF